MSIDDSPEGDNIDIFGDILLAEAGETNFQHANLREEAEHAEAEIQQLKADLLRLKEEVEQERVNRRELEADFLRQKEEVEQQRKELEASLQREREKVESLTKSLETDFSFTEALKELQNLDPEWSSLSQAAREHLENPVFQPHMPNPSDRGSVGEGLDTQGQSEIFTVIPQSTVEPYAWGREWNYWPQWDPMLHY